MRITFLGTSAGEGYPGVWCECPNCQKARQLGGRNIRGSSCVLLDDDFLIDMSAQFAFMAPRLGISPARIQGLLVTHPHMDHFAPEFLEKRAMAPALRGLTWAEKAQKISPCFTELPVLHVYGNAFVRKRLFMENGVMEQEDTLNVAFHLIREGVPCEQGDLRFTPVRAQHTPVRGFCHNYIIERGGKTLLFASDTGGYDEDMWALVLAHRYDCVVMEGTFGLGASVDGHMSLEKNRKMLALFREKELLREGAPFILTHICPHWTPPHDEYAAMMEKEGMVVAYDGMRIEF